MKSNQTKNAFGRIIGFLVFFVFSAFSDSGNAVPIGGARTQAPTEKRNGAKANWRDEMLSLLKAIESGIPKGSMGVYLKNLQTGQELSYRGEEFWYIASGTKIPVALEVLRSVDAGELSMESKVEVLESDYIDGAGELNYIKPGSKVSVRLLLDQSLTFSDNTATDMLIRLVGLEKINRLTGTKAPTGFKPITTLAHVRRRLFSAFHPDAQKLSKMDFIRIRALKDEEAKLERLSKLLKVDRAKFKHQTFDSAYEEYYSEGLNSATLRGVGLLFEKLEQGDLLKIESRKYLIDILDRVATGRNRIRAGLPRNYTFAHKTGTQHKRFCDMGIVTNGTAKSDRLVVVACFRHLSLERVEKAMKKIGESIHQSKALGGRK